MDILDVCDPTPDGFRYILVIADYFSKWTEAFPIKNKCADTVAEVLVDKIILRFGMPLVIHSDQGREFENGLMKSLCTLLGCVKTRTAPYHPESDGMVERFNRTCLMMLSMFVNDRRDNWHELLPFVMHLSLCENSLRPTLMVDRRVYWAEITPLLQRWQSVNNTSCPHCHRLIRVNMSRHLRASHTDNQCFWRCPVSTCHLWFSSELNGKDHLERIHGFREGQGCSFYECLRRFGMEWFGLRSYFDQREQSSQAMWMDMALARQSGQELINHYIITNSPATAHIRRFFHASIRHLTATYQRIAAEQAFNDIRPSVCDQMRQEMATIKEEFDPLMDEASGYSPSMVQDEAVRQSPVVVTPRRSFTNDKTRESPVVDPPRRSSTMDTTMESPVVEMPRRSSTSNNTSNNRSLAVMEASTLEAPRYRIPIARGAVNFTSIASLDLQTFIDPLPLDQLLCYSADTVQSWPTEDRDQILAVASRDLTVARRNLPGPLFLYAIL